MKLSERLKMRWVVWVWNRTPNCADMARLASQSLDQRLSLGTRLRMRLHYVICAWCQRYFKQLKFLHEAAPRFDEHTGILPQRGLSAEARRRILQTLRVAENKRS